MPYGGKEWFAKDANGEYPAEECHRFVALPALTLPIDIAEIQPEGKFVQDESGCNTIKHGRDPPGQARGFSRSGSDFKQPEIAHQQEKQDAPNHVVDVAAMHADVVKGTDIVVNGDRDDSDHENGGEEGKRGQEETFSSGLSKLAFVDLPQPGSRNDDREDRKRGRNEQRTDPETSVQPWHRTNILVRVASSPLKLEVQTELHLAHGDLNGGDLPGAAHVNCRVRVRQISVIENVESVGPQIQRFMFTHKQIFGE